MKFKLSAILISLLLLTACSSPEKATNSQSPESVVSVAPTVFKSTGNLKVHFIDVGQGDSILVQTPRGKAVLVDAGKKEDGKKVIDYIKSLGIQKLEALVYTYPADDHIGGMIDVANAFDITAAYMPRKMTKSPIQKEFLNMDKIKNTTRYETAPGTKVFIEGENNLSLDVVAPNDYSNDNLKDYSAVIKLTYGDTSFLLTGDATSVSEKLMLSREYDLRSTVLKVANHGSNESTTYEFLNAVAPKYAVISVGKGNADGNPSKEVLDRLNTAAVKTYRTDEAGTVVATTDGHSVNFETKTAVKASASPAANASASPAANTEKPKTN